MLKGTLEHFALADIFRLLSWAKKTGKIEVARPEGQGKVFFRDGEVYYAESSLSREPLGQKLIRSGMLTEANLRRALEQNSRSGEMIGQILLSNGWVTEHQLQTALKQQIEDSVFDMLSAKEGTFEFSPGVAVEIDVEIAVSVENLIMEASRRLDELDLIQRKIPSLGTVLRMSSKPPEGAAEINITAEEWRMLVMVNGERTITEIAQAVGKDSFGALRGLYGLVNSGLVEVVPDQAEAATATVVEPAISISPQPPKVSPGPMTPEPETEVVAVPELQVVQAPTPEDLESFEPEEPEPVAEEEPEVPEPSEPEPFVEAHEEPQLEVESVPTEVEDVSPLPQPEPAAPPAPRGRVLYGDSGPVFEPEPEDEPVDAASPSPPATEPPEEPARPAARTDLPKVDRSTVVRELAGLFSDDVAGSSTDHPEVPDNRKRVEDDEAVDKKLISKLIDGVKGL